MRVQSPGYASAVRSYGLPLIPGLDDPVRPISEVVALEHWMHELACYHEAAQETANCGTDPLVDGSCQAAGLVGWFAQNSALSKVAGAGPSGERVLQSVATAAVSGARQNNTGALIAANQTFIIAGLMRVTAGARLPTVYRSSGGVLWTGVGGGAWQAFLVLATSVAATDIIYGNVACAVGDAFQMCNLSITPLNIATLSDRHPKSNHLAQADAMKRPVLTAGAQPSGRYAAVFDGVNDYLKTTAFTLNQPETITAILKAVNNAANWYAFDGNGAASMALYHASGNPAGNMWAGGGPTSSVAACWDNTWKTVNCFFNGAGSAITINGGVPTAGNVGAANAGGLTVGSDGTGGALLSPLSFGSIFIHTRPLSVQERVSIESAARRRACI